MLLTKKCLAFPYRKDGVDDFSKAVPKDLLDLYCKPRMVECLGTRSPQSARFVVRHAGQARGLRVGCSSKTHGSANA